MVKGEKNAHALKKKATRRAINKMIKEIAN